MRLLSAAVAVLMISLLVSSCGGGNPKITAGTPLDDAYATLHDAGFRVAVRVPSRYTLETDSWNGLVVSRDLRPDGHVATLAAGPTGLGQPVGFRYPAHLHVPNFVGGSAEAAMAWAGSHGVTWQIRKLPNLPPSNSRQLYRAYTVVGQNYPQGSTMTQNDWLRLKVEPR